MEEYEKEEVLDTVNIIESGDSTSDTSNDSTVDDGTVKFRTFLFWVIQSQLTAGIFQVDMPIIIHRAGFLLRTRGGCCFLQRKI